MLAKTIEKFAWKPIRVWDMTTGNYKHKTIWLRWYYDYGEETCKTDFYKLSDDPYEAPMQSNRYCRTNTNKW